ncbi:MAG: Trm112 family protein [Candidatus Aminicenantes bacterium]|nr:Trm112 family protein [Candidatus Aminicenantes bacterium]
MKQKTLDLLCCPECRSPVFLREKAEDNKGIIESGILVCEQCRR